MEGGAAGEVKWRYLLVKYWEIERKRKKGKGEETGKKDKEFLLSLEL